MVDYKVFVSSRNLGAVEETPLARSGAFSIPCRL
jgi:hypothetical protein